VLSFLPLLAVAFFAMMVVGGGCQEVHKRSYSVDVRNESDMPVTVWMTKEGGLYETNWKSPEDLAIETRNVNEQIAGFVIRPGENAGIGPVEGQFTPHARAMLRVYLGAHGMSELLSMSRGAPDRRDYELSPGANSFRVVSRDGMTLVERGGHGQPMSMSTDNGGK